MRKPTSRAGPSTDAWEEEAWASNLDDDEFVARLQTRRTSTDTTLSTQGNGAYERLTLQETRVDLALLAPSTGDALHTAPNVVPAPPQPDAATESSVELDPYPANWAEKGIAFAPIPTNTHAGRAARIHALVDDPMLLVEMYRPQLVAFQHERSSDDARRSDISTSHEAAHAQNTSSRAPSAAAFDPLATSGDGVMMPVVAPLTPVPPRPQNPAKVRRYPSTRTRRIRQQLVQCLEADEIDLGFLRSLAWKGVPNELRAVVWPLLLGYLPTQSSLRAATLARKRAEYAEGVQRAFAQGLEEVDRAIWHQIYIDVPRTNPGIRLWQQEATQRALERILYVWAIRHPASGYVQGINDLVTPFFEVFLSAYIDSDPEQFELADLPQHVLAALEADTFWCLSKLLDGIQDNYTLAQPGIQRQLRRMGEVVARIDAPLHTHLAAQGVE
ncbi:Gyp1p [Malassezia vespertilionis]|uniref:Gyp1p n=2 Tax=Malassezia vespertilionis TaxID=2020962 RepID=A0A2N1JG62_9BASI|nr:Gyp1p [Malassezia vespertilionis]